jgi:hypothetical protein
MNQPIHICVPTRPCQLALAAIEALQHMPDKCVIVNPPEEPPPPPAEVHIFRRPDDFPYAAPDLPKQPTHFPNYGRGKRHGKRF